MKTDPDSFAILIDRVRDGDRKAAEDLVSRYEDTVLRAVRRKLNRRMRKRFDSIDFSQDVWKSFFGNLREIGEFQRPEELTAFLTRVSANKVIDECRRSLISKKNNINREQSMNDSVAMEGNIPPGNQATPSEFAIAGEQRDLLLHDQSPEYRKIIELRLQGLNHGEIAERMQVSRRTILRFFQRLAERLDE